MNAREVMTSPVISATANTPVRDIAQLLLKNHISAVPILDYTGAPIGMVSEGDLIGRRNGAARVVARVAGGRRIAQLRFPFRVTSPRARRERDHVKAGRHRRRGHG